MLELCSLLLALSFAQASPAAGAGGRIAGRVTVEGTNTPLAGVRVMLIPAAPRMGMMGMPPQATTDQDGRYAFERVALLLGERLNSMTGELSPSAQVGVVSGR